MHWQQNKYTQFIYLFSQELISPLKVKPYIKQLIRIKSIIPVR